MTSLLKIQLGLLAVGAVLAGWQLRQHARLDDELAAVEAQVQTNRQELEAREAAFVTLQKRNLELEETERRAGNDTLVSLMHERAAVAKSVSEAAAQTHSLENALASVLASPEQRQLEQDYKRQQMKAGMGLFFKLAKLPPEKVDQFIDVQIEMERRKADRMTALLRGQESLADALRERDNDEQESQNQKRAILGPEASGFLESIADNMRNDEAKRLLNLVQQNMGDNRLNADQSDRLQALLKAQTTMPFDETDLFRTPEALTQLAAERQQTLLNEAAIFVTPAQLETLRAIAAADLAQKQQAMMTQRKSLGIK